MKIEGQRSYSVGRDVLWSILNDPVAVSRLLPGCQAFEPVSPDVYRLVVDVRLGRAVERLAGTLSSTQVDPYRSLTFLARSESPSGPAECRGRVELKDAGDSAATLAYEAVLTPGEGLSISSRMLETTARAFARRALDALEQEAAIRTRVYTTTTQTMDTTTRSTPPDVAIHRLAFARRVLGLGLIVLVAWILSRSVERLNARRTRRQIAEVVEQVLEQVELPPAAPPMDGRPPDSGRE